MAEIPVPEAVLPRLIPAREVRRRCAGISQVTLYRWLRDPALGFPQPIRINNRMFFAEERVADWLDRQAARQAPGG